MHVCGVLRVSLPRDEFIKAICAACLPEHYSSLAEVPPKGWQVRLQGKTIVKTQAYLQLTDKFDLSRLSFCLSLKILVLSLVLFSALTRVSFSFAI